MQLLLFTSYNLFFHIYFPLLSPDRFTVSQIMLWNREGTSMACGEWDRASTLLLLSKHLTKAENLEAKVKILVAQYSGLICRYRALNNGCCCHPALETKLGMINCLQGWVSSC